MNLKLVNSNPFSDIANQNKTIVELLAYATEKGCSDLYVKKNDSYYVSRYGKIYKLPCVAMSNTEWDYIIREFLTSELNFKYGQEKSIDCSVEIPVPKESKYYDSCNYFRYRANLGFSKGVPIATFRMVRPIPPTFNTINFPVESKNILEKAFSKTTGITFISGATGSGKNLYKNTLIPTTNGFKKLKDIKIGDIIFDEDGNLTRVVDKYSPDEVVFYELGIKINDNLIKQRCGASHLWQIDFYGTVDTNKIVELLDNNIEVNIVPRGKLKYNKKPSRITPKIVGKYYGKYIRKEVDDKLYYLEEYLEHDIEFKETLFNNLEIGQTFKARYKTEAIDFRRFCLSINKGVSKIRYNKKEKVYEVQLLDYLKYEIVSYKRVKGRSKDYICLSVDSKNKTFICNEELIVTHNSTTFASCFNDFKHTILNNKIVITLEDPIENTFENTNSFKINQKELTRDFKSFDLGIKFALREHPNLILIGECRDKEVISATIEASRTGHSVATTFHSGDVPTTISRLLYHLGGDKNLAYDLILNLNLIMCQRLIPNDDKYIVDTQYLYFDDVVVKYIVENILESEKEKNVIVEIKKLFKNEYLLKNNYIKDWSYSND